MINYFENACANDNGKYDNDNKGIMITFFLYPCSLKQAKTNETVSECELISSKN